MHVIHVDLFKLVLQYVYLIFVYLDSGRECLVISRDTTTEPDFLWEAMTCTNRHYVLCENAKGISLNFLSIKKSQMNIYIVRSYRDVIVITKFAITKYAIRRASKAQRIVMY